MVDTPEDLPPPRMRECPFCGERQAVRGRFCPRCGNQYPFDDDAEAGLAEVPTGRVARSARSPWYRTIPFLAAVVLGVLVLGYGLFRFGMAYFEGRRPDPSADPGPVLTGSPTRPAGSPVAAASPSPVVISPSPSPVAVSRARVANTDGQGANLRQSPSTTAEVLKSLPDGTVVEVIGSDQQAAGRTWRHIRDPEGTSGWVAAELLVAE